MTQYKIKLSEGAAIFAILLLTGAVVLAASYFFQAFSFPWFAGCAVGYGAVVTFSREYVSVYELSEEAAAGTLDRALNKALMSALTILFSTPVLFVVVAVALTLFFAFVDTYGPLPTIAVGFVLYALLNHVSQIASVRPDE